MVIVARAIFNDPTPVFMLQEQQASRVEPPITSSMWVSHDTFCLPAHCKLSEVLGRATAALASEAIDIPVATAVSVEGEWVGNRLDPCQNEQNEAILTPDEQTYDSLLKDAKSNAVLIYLHGGQF